MSENWVNFLKRNKGQGLTLKQLSIKYHQNGGGRQQLQQLQQRQQRQERQQRQLPEHQLSELQPREHQFQLPEWRRAERQLQVQEHQRTEWMSQRSRDVRQHNQTPAETVEGWIAINAIAPADLDDFEDMIENFVKTRFDFVQLFAVCRNEQDETFMIIACDTKAHADEIHTALNQSQLPAKLHFTVSKFTFYPSSSTKTNDIALYPTIFMGKTQLESFRNTTLSNVRSRLQDDLEEGLQIGVDYNERGYYYFRRPKNWTVRQAITRLCQRPIYYMRDGIVLIPTIRRV